MSNKIQYRQVGDFCIPNLVLPPEETAIRLSKWGMMHKDHLLDHRKVLFTTLFSQGKLWQYLADIDTQAQQMFDSLVEQMKQAEGITENLKEENQLEWVQQINNIQGRARDTVCKGIIYI